MIKNNKKKMKYLFQKTITDWNNNKTYSLQKAEKIISEGGTLYEVLTEDKIYKYYFDFDLNIETKSDYNDYLDGDKDLMNYHDDLISELRDHFNTEDIYSSSNHGEVNGVWKISYHFVVNKIGSVWDMKEVAKKLKNNNDAWDTVPYRTKGLWRLPTSKKDHADQRKPLIIKGKFEDFIVQNHSEEQPQPKTIEEMVKSEVKLDIPTISTAIADTPSVNDTDGMRYKAFTLLENILKFNPDIYIKSKWWWKLLICFKSAFPNQKALFLEFSLKIKGQVDDKIYNKWSVNNSKIWDTQKTNTPCPIQTIENMVFVDHTIPYPVCKELFYIFKDRNDEVICDFICKHYGEYWKYISKNEIYKYDPVDCLWKRSDKVDFNAFLTNHFSPVLDSFINWAMKRGAWELEILTARGVDGLKVYTDGYIQLSSEKNLTINKLINSISKHKNTSSKNALREEFFGKVEIKDRDFIHKSIQQNISLLSVKNGVVDLRTGILRPRVKEDFFTWALRLDYKADHTSDKYEKFVKELFSVKAFEGEVDQIYEVFITFMGYLLTGETKEEKIVNLYGGGSNGKSLNNAIISHIMDTQAGGTNICIPSIDGKIFDDKAHNPNINAPSPIMVGLKGIRLAIIEEGDSIVYGEVFKKLITNNFMIKARDLHESLQEFKSVCKFCLGNNNFPKFPVDQQCFRRRVENGLFPMNMEFVKSSGRTLKDDQREVDTDLKNKLLSGDEPEKILCSMVRGAMNYYKNGLLDQPPKLRKVSLDLIEDNDWVNKFFILNKEDLTKQDIKEYKWLMTVDAVYKILKDEFSEIKKDQIKKKMIEELGRDGVKRKNTTDLQAQRYNLNKSDTGKKDWIFGISVKLETHQESESEEDTDTEEEEVQVI